MRVLLVDADSHNGFPNLALMKISAYHKNLGDHVELIKGIPDTGPLVEYDVGYISCIFFQNMDKVHRYYRLLPFPVKVGGSGWDHKKLAEDIEHIRPDYSLYSTDFSLGFTSRGCPNNCGFCIVPKKEGPIRDNAPIQEFLHPDHKKVVLLDGNFLASPKWRENLEFIIANKVKVNFNQGLDIRLVNEENAQLLAECKYYNWSFSTRGLHFAFDDLRYMWEVQDGIHTLLDAGIKPFHLMFYVLIGYNTTKQEDKFRAELLKSFGVKPYIMTFDQHDSKWSKNIERYYNGRWHEFIPFEDYNNGVLLEEAV